MKRSILVFTALFLLLSVSACAENEPGSLTWTEVVLEGRAGSRISFPEFAGGEAADKINSTIRADACLDEYIQLMASLSEGGTGLRIGHTVYPGPAAGPYVSVILSAKGRMLKGRPSQIWYAFVFDTATGERVALDDLFTDPEAAHTVMEETAAAEEETLSDYLENRELLPLPYEDFGLSPAGIVLCYPYDQLSTLSGYAGQIIVPWHLLAGRMTYLPEAAEPDGNTREKTAEAASRGMIYSLPARVGSDAETALETFRCSIDAGYYPDGLAFEVEDAAMTRNIIVTDGNAEKVTGIIAHHVNCAGIITGVTGRAGILDVMGDPDESGEVSESGATERLLTPGTLDGYTFDGYVLGFNCDEEGVLRAVTLFRTED